MLEFKQSEQTATKRIWFFQLTNIAPASEVPSGLKNNSNVTFTVLNPPQYLTLNGQTLTAGTDYTIAGLTITMTTPPLSTDTFLSWYANAPLTGQTGHGYLSTNGAAGVISTNTFTEIDATNMPGSYYLQLAQSEVGALGSLNLYVKTTSSNAFNAQAIVSYNDPYASQGGFVAPSNVTGGFTKGMSDDLLKKIRKMIAEEFAKDEEEDDAEEVVEQKDYTEKLDAILTAVSEPEDDRTDEILTAISNIPKLTDFTKLISTVLSEVKGLSGLLKTDLGAFEKAVKEFESKIGSAGKEINGVSTGLKTLRIDFEALAKTIQEYKATLADQSDLDKRMDAMISGRNDEKLSSLIASITEMEKKLLINMVNFKFDLLEQLTLKKK